MNLRLTRYRSDRPLWTKSIDIKKKVYNKAPVYVVKALSELLEQQLRQVCRELVSVVGHAGKGNGEK